MRKPVTETVLLAIGLFFIAAAPADAAAPWSVLKTRAENKAGLADGRVMPDSQCRTAIEMIRRADIVLQKDRSDPTCRAMLAIYAQAGQMLEKAANDYAALIPSGQATGADIEGALTMMRRCVTTIKQIQARRAGSR